MDLARALSVDLKALEDSANFDDLLLTADALNRSVQSAISSHIGVQLTVYRLDQPITLSVIDPAALTDNVATSVTLTLPTAPGQTTGDRGPRLTCFAGTDGALVDLAADLAYALHIPVRDIHWDLAIETASFTTGITGLTELSTIERAAGLLIGSGHHPDHALEYLGREARKNHSSIAAEAHRVLASASLAPQTENWSSLPPD